MNFFCKDKDVGKDVHDKWTNGMNLMVNGSF